MSSSKLGYNRRRHFTKSLLSGSITFFYALANYSSAVDDVRVVINHKSRIQFLLRNPAFYPIVVWL